MYDADALAGDLDGLGDLHGIVVHQHHVGGLDGGIAAHGAHGDADIGTGQHRRIVDAVAHEGQAGLAALPGQQLLHLGHLVAGQQLAADLVHTQLRRHFIGHPLGVAGQHDGLFHAGALQGGDGRLGVGLYHVGDNDVSGVLAVHGHVDDGAYAVALVEGDAQPGHQLAVAGGHLMAVHYGLDAVAADLLDIRDPVTVDGSAIRLLQALADGVGGGALGQGGVFQQLVLVHLVVVDGGDLEHALGQGAGLVKDHTFGVGQLLQIVGALDEDALAAGAADAGEEAEGDADDQGAGTADHQEGQGTVDPVRPLGLHPQHQTAQGEQDAQHRCRGAHRRGIHPGEPGDKGLGAGFAGASVLHQIQDLGHGGFPELLGGADLQHAAHVDAAADDLVTLLHVTGQALAGEGAGVQAGAAADHHAVQRHLLAGLHHDDAAHGNFVGVHLLQLAVPLDVGVIGADVHQGADVPAALAHGVALEQLTDLVEQHDGDALYIVAALRPDGQEERTQGGDGHQEVLVKDAAVDDALARLAQDVVADHQIGDQVGDQLGDAGQRDELQGQQHGRRNEDADQHHFLFLRHGHDAPFQCGARHWAGHGVILQLDLAVGLHLLAGIQHVLHDGLGVLALFKLHDHLLGHEIDGGRRHAAGFLGGFLHQVGAVGAVNFDLVGLFHDDTSIYGPPLGSTSKFYN